MIFLNLYSSKLTNFLKYLINWYNFDILHFYIARTHVINIIMLSDVPYIAIPYQL